MSFLRNIHQLEIDWQRSYLWDFHIPGCGKDWLPAIDIEENLATLNSKEFNFYISTYKVPQATTAFDLKITYVDDEKLTISTFFADWVNKEILVGGKYIQTVEDACKVCHVHKLNHARVPIKQSAYLVYPEGASYFSGNSESSAVTYSQQLVIAGAIGA